MKDPINTLQELERNSKTRADGCAPNPMHTAEWLAAFGAQATQRTMDAVAAHVAKRATWIRAQQGDAAPHVINAMVSDALGDTFADVVTWNPLRCSLAIHLKSVIRTRLSHELERNEDHPHVDIETASEHEVNEALLNGGKTTPTKRLGRNVKEFTSRLRAAAADDLAVLTLIDLHLQDITERGQICHITGMKPGAYHNAFRRLKRLADKLPEELRAAAVEELAGTVVDASGHSASPRELHVITTKPPPRLGYCQPMQRMAIALTFATALAACTNYRQSRTTAKVGGLTAGAGFVAAVVGFFVVEASPIDGAASFSCGGSNACRAGAAIGIAGILAVPVGAIIVLSGLAGMAHYAWGTQGAQVTPGSQGTQAQPW